MLFGGRESFQIWIKKRIFFFFFKNHAEACTVLGLLGLIPFFWRQIVFILAMPVPAAKSCCWKL